MHLHRLALHLGEDRRPAAERHQRDRREDQNEREQPVSAHRRCASRRQASPMPIGASASTTGIIGRRSTPTATKVAAATAQSPRPRTRRAASAADRATVRQPRRRHPAQRRGDRCRAGNARLRRGQHQDEQERWPEDAEERRRRARPAAQLLPDMEREVHAVRPGQHLAEGEAGHEALLVQPPALAHHLVVHPSRQAAAEARHAEPQEHAEDRTQRGPCRSLHHPDSAASFPSGCGRGRSAVEGARGVGRTPRRRHVPTHRPTRSTPMERSPPKPGPPSGSPADRRAAEREARLAVALRTQSAPAQGAVPRAPGRGRRHRRGRSRPRPRTSAAST